MGKQWFKSQPSLSHGSHMSEEECVLIAARKGAVDEGWTSRFLLLFFGPESRWLEEGQRRPKNVCGGRHRAQM